MARAQCKTHAATPLARRHLEPLHLLGPAFIGGAPPLIDHRALGGRGRSGDRRPMGHRTRGASRYFQCAVRKVSLPGWYSRGDVAEHAGMSRLVACDQLQRKSYERRAPVGERPGMDGGHCVVVVGSSTAHSLQHMFSRSHSKLWSCLMFSRPQPSDGNRDPCAIGFKKGCSFAQRVLCFRFLWDRALGGGDSSGLHSSSLPLLALARHSVSRSVAFGSDLVHQESLASVLRPTDAP